MNVPHPFASKPIRAGGFTLIELLVVVATVGMLAMVLLPALAATKPDSQSFQCTWKMSNSWCGTWQGCTPKHNNDLLPPNDYPYLTGLRYRWRQPAQNEELGGRVHHGCVIRCSRSAS